MKFSRYLEDTQTPEWKRAYIDYRGLKKCITAIRKSQEEYSAHFSDQQSPPMRLQPLRFSHIHDSVPPPRNVLGLFNLSRVSLDCPSIHQSEVCHDHCISIQPPQKAFSKSSCDPEIEVNPRRSMLYMTPAGEIEAYPSANLNDDTLRHSQVKHDPGLSIFSKNSNLQRRRRHLSLRFSFVSTRTAPQLAIEPCLVEGLSLSEVSRLFTLQEQQFFVMLDAELEKVDAFYGMKESELQVRTRRLSEQLKELANHKRIVHENSSSFMPRLWLLDGTGNSDMVEGQKASPSTDFEPNEARGIRHPNDPENYVNAERKLKKAVTEHYREIEALVNYRILNITGFRKALKKFEKVTKVPVQGQYMSEKIDKTGFMNDQAVKRMMQEMEKLYAQAFTRNDSKNARDYLRGGGRRVTSHHFSTFKSGLCLGVALPLFISTLYELCSQSSRNQIPYWQSILHVYGVLFLPAIYPLLVFLNIYSWSRFRINYVFIFELDTRTRLDMYECLELPTFIFATFCLVFWLSFSSIGRSYVDWDILPLVWLGFVAIFLLNPLTVWFKDSRYWFLKLFGNLFLSGIRRVEFADFWLADQLSSFTYSFGGLVYIACIYAATFNEQDCGSEARVWGAQWALGSLPMFIRLAQCLKRYHDSMLKMHLLNASRYASGILALLIFNLWRALGNAISAKIATIASTYKLGTSSGYLSAWCMTNTFYSLFSCGWDFCMDWSLITLQSQHPFLREELVYSNYIYVYHIGIVLNVILRFTWIIYIPVPNAGLDFRIRSFIVAFLEMLRRILWNVFRLENEHIGNVDQYRIVREVPLPYTLDDVKQLDDDGDSFHVQGLQFS